MSTMTPKSQYIKQLSLLENDVIADVKANCLECVFWYRCKRGLVDCELKA